MVDPARPLLGLRVLDCSSGSAGPRASGFLADYGAEVIWVEPAGGDPFRRSDPAAASVYNRGKRSIVLDLACARNRDRVLDLAERSDIFLESWEPGVADAKGLGYEAVHRRAPGLIYCSISGFGADSTLRHLKPYEPIVHAMFGSMAQQLGHREGPIYPALPFASSGAAQLAVLGILCALYRRLADGHGRHVETSLVDGALAFYTMQWGETDQSVAAASSKGPTINPMLRQSSLRMITRSFLCGDGEYLGVHTLATGAFDRLMAVLGLADRIPPIRSGNDLATPLTPEQADYLEKSIHSIFAGHSRAEWLTRLIEADVCAIEHLPPTQVFDHRQAQHNRMVLTIDDPVLGPVEQVAPYLRFDDRTPQPAGAAPAAGTDTAEVLASLRTASAPSPWQPIPPSRMIPDGRALLDGVRIVDLGAFYAGPFASRLLADLGADVIKVEPVAGDPLRGLERAFFAAQAGKRSLAVNLKDVQFLPVSQALMQWADVVHHNMRPGAAERVGFGRDQVRTVNPDAIYLYSPGWGSSGPDMMRQSFAPMLLNLSGGSFEVAGQHNEPMPPLPNEDIGNGISGAIAIVIGLLVRRRHGHAFYCESPQLNAAMHLMSHIVRTRDGTRVGAGRLDVLQVGTSALESLYQTADGWLCLTARTENEIEALQNVLGTEILGDPAFATAEARSSHREALWERLSTAFARGTSLDWLARLETSGVPLLEPAGTSVMHAFLNEPEQRKLGRVAEVAQPQKGRVRELASLFRISDTTPPAHRLAPDLGEHNAEILTMLDAAEFVTTSQADKR